MRRRYLFLLTAAVSSSLFGFDDVKLRPITLTGTVIDTGCYVVHDGIGADHEECARECAKKGIALAILDGEGKLYLPLGIDHSNPNTQLLPFVEQKVKITGTLAERGGLSGISIKKVEAAK